MKLLFVITALYLAYLLGSAGAYVESYDDERKIKYVEDKIDSHADWFFEDVIGERFGV